MIVEKAQGRGLMFFMAEEMMEWVLP